MQPHLVRDVQAECPSISTRPANHIEYCLLVARKHGARVRALPEALIVHRDILPVSACGGTIEATKTTLVLDVIWELLPTGR